MSRKTSYSIDVKDKDSMEVWVDLDGCMRLKLFNKRFTETPEEFAKRVSSSAKEFYDELTTLQQLVDACQENTTP